MKVIVAGGDGSISSVVDHVQQIRRVQWEVAIVPLGTGNDLSRALGWGYALSPFFDPSQFLLDLSQNRTRVMLDRWKVTLQQADNRQEMTMQNYFGIGLDAQFCLRFDRLRKKYPSLFRFRIGNKFIYSQIGL